MNSEYNSYEKKYIRKHLKRTLFISIFLILVSFIITFVSDLFLNSFITLYKYFLYILRKREKGIIYLKTRDLSPPFGKLFSPFFWGLKLLFIIPFPLLLIDRQRVITKKASYLSTRIEEEGLLFLKQAKGSSLFLFPLYNLSFLSFSFWFLVLFLLSLSTVFPYLSELDMIEKENINTLSPKILVLLMFCSIFFVKAYTDFLFIRGPVCYSKKKNVSSKVFWSIFRNAFYNCLKLLLIFLFFFCFFRSFLDCFFTSFIVLFLPVSDGETTWKTLLDFQLLSSLLCSSYTNCLLLELFYQLSEWHLTRCIYSSNGKTSFIIEGLSSKNVLIREQAFMELLCFKSEDKFKQITQKEFGELVCFLRKKLEKITKNINILADYYREIESVTTRRSFVSDRNVSKNFGGETQIPSFFFSENLKKKTKTNIKNGWMDKKYSSLLTNKITKPFTVIYMDFLLKCVIEDTQCSIWTVKLLGDIIKKGFEEKFSCGMQKSFLYSIESIAKCYKAVSFLRKEMMFVFRKEDQFYCFFKGKFETFSKELESTVVWIATESSRKNKDLSIDGEYLSVFKNVLRVLD